MFCRKLLRDVVKSVISKYSEILSG